MNRSSVGVRWALFMAVFAVVVTAGILSVDASMSFEGRSLLGSILGLPYKYNNIAKGAGALGMFIVPVGGPMVVLGAYGRLLAHNHG